MSRPPKQIAERARRIIRAGIKVARRRLAREQIEAMRLHLDGYAEPGYHHSAVIVTGDFWPVGRWEDCPMKWVIKDATPERVGELLGRAGVEVEWSDGWMTCGWCGKLVCSTSTSASWLPSYWRHPLGVLCRECVQRDPCPYLRWLDGREARAETLGIDLVEHGYRPVMNGLQFTHDDQRRDDPNRIARSLRRQGVGRFIFRLDRTSRSMCEFSVCVHESEIDFLQRPKAAMIGD